MANQTREHRNIPIARILLTIIGTAGVLSVALIAPNALQALTLFGFGKRKHYSRKYVQNAFSRLKQRGLIRLEERKGKYYVRLTQKGKDELGRYQRREYKVQKPKRWDGKWRLVIFDIGEEKRTVRNNLRRQLQHFGFYQLQKSVWVYPHDCEDFLVLMKGDLRIGKDVLYVTAERVENDVFLQRMFNVAKR